ncbi:hypothetical protein [Methanobacterium formicicum]|uniref:Bacterial repeat domain-containing protein n=1 Tax=Methanobacterium formicicum (strain DSM 3637 / PP1) TaxID=1204725 RepID=K2R1W7_METFP|nr:hypothetical protein [Methanobacterium formicicum]EKF86518.1 hypothetical protein A994_03508 [Methanobacterium formicicum DSM 3637]
MTCQVSISAGDNGKISPEGEIIVEKSSHVYLHAKPEPGYQVQMWSVNGNQLYGGTKEFRVTAEGDNLEVHVTFSKI